MIQNNGSFEFSSVDSTLDLSEMGKMYSSKMINFAILTDELRITSSASYEEIAYHINNPITTSTNTFPDILTLADVSPVFTKGGTLT